MVNFNFFIEEDIIWLEDYIIDVCGVMVDFEDLLEGFNIL